VKPFVSALCIAALAVCALDGCSRKPAPAALEAPSAAGGETQLPCGSKTYRVSAAAVDDEVRGACERARQSESALQAYRATLTRFTCQGSDGHVVSSVQVPRAQYDDYERNCRQYLTTEEAFRNHTADIGAHQSALRDYIAASNVLTKKHVEDDNALFRQRQADQAAVSTLVKSRGGSIEIRN
jgi:hypothetical protein